MANSDIIFSGLGFPDYCCRGVDVEVTPIPASKQYRRDANGTLHDVSDPVFRKYQVKVSATDQQFPDLGGVWPGMPLTVTTCIVWGASTGATFVTGYTATATGATAPTGYGYTGTAVKINGRVTDWSVTDAEWSADKSWSLTVEEY